MRDATESKPSACPASGVPALAESDLAKDDAYGWIDPAILSQAIPRRRKHNRKIGRLAALQSSGDGTGVRDSGLHMVAAGLFELWNELVHRRCQRIRAEKTDFHRA
jgi:hypothetical protein